MFSHAHRTPFTSTSQPARTALNAGRSIPFHTVSRKNTPIASNAGRSTVRQANAITSNTRMAVFFMTSNTNPTTFHMALATTATASNTGLSTYRHAQSKARASASQVARMDANTTPSTAPATRTAVFTPSQTGTITPR